MLFDRRGQFGITHVMRMPWDTGHAPRERIDATSRGTGCAASSADPARAARLNR